MSTFGSVSDLAADLLERVRAAERGDLPALVQALTLAVLAAVARLVAPEDTRLLTVADAAQLVSLPERRLRSLARGESWALRVGGALRIDQAGLLAWARKRARSQRAGNATDQAAVGASDVHSAHESARTRRGRALRTVTR